MRNNRYANLMNSDLFKESAEHEEEDFTEEEDGATEVEALDTEEVTGEDLSYLSELDEEEDAAEDDEDFNDEDTDDGDDFDEEGDDFEDSNDEEGFDDDFEEGDDEFSDEEEYGDDDCGTDGEAPQLTANTYDSGKAEEEPKMFYPSEDEVTLEVIEETGNGAVGDEPALVAMDIETPEVESVEVGESQTSLPEIPDEFSFDGTYDEDDGFDNGFGANLEVEEDMGSDDDFEGADEDFGDEESAEDDDFADDEEGFDEDFDDEEEGTDDEFEDAEGVDFGDDEFDDTEADDFGDDDDFDDEEDI